MSANRARRQDSVIMLLLGTTGDVLPLLPLARALSLHSCCSHLTVAAPVSELDALPEEQTAATAQLSFVPLYTAHNGKRQREQATEHQDSTTEVQNQSHFDECLHVAMGHDCVIFNLFALVGWLIAQYIGAVPIAVSPCLIPYSVPSSFDRQFRRSNPLLWKKLHHDEASTLNWQQVAHWMWPLFLDKYDGWRQASLSLPPCPLDHSDPLPRATPLLYGFSELLIPKPGYWPASVHVCGFWGVERGTVTKAQLSPKLDEFIRKNDSCGGVLYCGFGSMTRLGVLQNPAQVVHSALAAAEIVGIGGVVFHVDKREGELAEAWCAASVDEQMGFCLVGPIDHLVLLPRCRAALHHGGSGTVAAAAYAGVPQLICPLIFDQPQWADRVVWTDVGCSVSLEKLLQPPQLAEVLQKVILPEVKAAAASLQQLLIQEDDAVQAGVALIVTELDNASCTTSPYPSPAEAAAGPELSLEPSVEPALVSMPNGLQVCAPNLVEATHIYREVWDRHVYTQRGIELREGTTVVDIGAHVGLFALFVASRLEQVQLICVEPSSESCLACRTNLELHTTAAAQHQVVNALASACVSDVKQYTYYPRLPSYSTTKPLERLKYSSALNGGRQLLEESSARNPTCVTVSGLIASYKLTKIDLLKIDVEGDEYQVLLGVEQKDWHRIEQVVMEAHKEGSRLADIKRVLSDAGFCVFIDQDEELGHLGNYMVYAHRN